MTGGRLKVLRCAAALAAILTAGTLSAQAAELRYALGDDPDALDPMTARTGSGLAVLMALCDRLVNVDSNLNMTPGLAQSWAWSDDNKTLTLKLLGGVTFHDGTPFDAEAVKFNLIRDKTPGSARADDAAPITSVDVIDPLTVAIHLSQPNAALLGKMAQRLGMVLSPTAIKAQGDNIGRSPVCSGPYKFTQRIAQDRIVVDKYPAYRDASQYFFDRITFRIISDDAVRLVNLQAGDIDLMERLDPSSVSVVEQNKALKVVPVPMLNYQSIVINMAGKYADLPMAKDVRVRQAFDAAIDRQAIVDVAFAGQYTAGNQFVPPGNQYYDPSMPVPPRDLDKAKALLKAAGYTKPVPFTILVPNQPLPVRVAQMVQTMTNEAGFDTKLNVVDFATTLNMTDQGNFESWGPIGPGFANDPDSVTYMSLDSIGNRNVGKYKNPEMDRIMDMTRAETDPAKRRALFIQAEGIIAKDKALIYLYHTRPIFAAKANLVGFSTTGEGLVNFRGLKLQ